MSQDNQITLRGYLTAEPKLYQKTATTTPVTEIRVGSTPRRLNRETGEWQDAPTSYFKIKCWRRLAINTASSLHKGDMVVVRGRFYMNHWVDSQQQSRSTLEIEADSVGHDLAYGWSHFLRAGRPPAESSAGVNAGEMARQDTGPTDPDDHDDEYSADGDLGEPRGTASAPGGPAEPGSAAHPGSTAAPGDGAFTGDPAAAAQDIPVTDGNGDGDGAGDGIGHRDSVGDPGDSLAASRLTDDASLPEPDAVPF